MPYGYRKSVLTGDIVLHIVRFLTTYDNATQNARMCIHASNEFETRIFGFRVRQDCMFLRQFENSNRHCFQVIDFFFGTAILLITNLDLFTLRYVTLCGHMSNP